MTTHSYVNNDTGSSTLAARVRKAESDRDTEPRARATLVPRWVLAPGNYKGQVDNMEILKFEGSAHLFNPGRREPVTNMCALRSNFSETQRCVDDPHDDNWQSLTSSLLASPSSPARVCTAMVQLRAVKIERPSHSP